MDIETAQKSLAILRVFWGKLNSTHGGGFFPFPPAPVEKGFLVVRLAFKAE